MAYSNEFVILQRMKLIFLGTGTSTGIPQIACKCKVCTSVDVRDKRLRASVLITNNQYSVLVDCGPDFRQQMLKHNIDNLKSIVITHEHYDHIGGIDDVRPYGNVQIYAEKRVNTQIMQSMPYCFKENPYPGVPKLTLNNIDNNPFIIGGIAIQPIRIMHAKLPIYGYRFGNLAYLTDVKTLEDVAYEQLKDLDVLILNALRVQPHIAHITLDEALVIAKKIGAKNTYFTHFSHDLGLHAEVESTLPSGIYLSYDNLELEF